MHTKPPAQNEGEAPKVCHHWNLRLPWMSDKASNLCNRANKPTTPDEINLPNFLVATCGQVRATHENDPVRQVNFVRAWPCPKRTKTSLSVIYIGGTKVSLNFASWGLGNLGSSQHLQVESCASLAGTPSTRRTMTPLLAPCD